MCCRVDVIGVRAAAIQPTWVYYDYYVYYYFWTLKVPLFSDNKFDGDLTASWCVCVCIFSAYTHSPPAKTNGRTYYREKCCKRFLRSLRVCVCVCENESVIFIFLNVLPLSWTSQRHHNNHHHRRHHWHHHRRRRRNHNQLLLCRGPWCSGASEQTRPNKLHTSIGIAVLNRLSYNRLWRWMSSVDRRPSTTSSYIIIIIIIIFWWNVFRARSRD